MRSLDSEITELSGIYGVDEVAVKAILKCESGMYPQAEHINSNGTKDHGIWQINDIHAETMRQRGLDILKSHDTLIFGFQLMREQGYRPWKASAKCWQPLLASGV